MADEDVAGTPAAGAPQDEGASIAPSGDGRSEGRGHTRASFLKRAAVAGAGTSITGSILAACGSGGEKTVAAESPSVGAVKPNIATKYKNKTVGLLELTTADENQLAIIKGAQAAAEEAELGWSWKAIDTKGSTSAQQQGITSFLTQKVDGIFNIACAAATLEAQLKQAKAQKVPVIGTYTFAPPESSITQDYTLPPSADASLLGYFLIAEQERLHPTGKIQVAMLDFPINIIQERRYAFESLVSQHPRIEIVAKEFSVSVTNTEVDASTKAKALMSAHPNLAAIWCNYPPIATPAASAVEQVGKTSQVKVYGHIAESSGVEALRGSEKAMRATSWVDWPYVGYMLVDQLLLAMSGKTPNRLTSVLRPDPSTVFSADNVEAEVPKGTKAANWMFGRGSYRAQFMKEWTELYG